MRTFATFSRRFAAAFIATNLAIAGAAGFNAVTTVSAAAAEVVSHGAWQSVTMTIDGRRLDGVKKVMDDGSVAAFLLDGSQIKLVVTNDHWHLRIGEATPIVFAVDCVAPSVTAKAESPTTIVVSGLTTFDFQMLLVAGTPVELHIGLDDGIDWALGNSMDLFLSWLPLKS